MSIEDVEVGRKVIYRPFKGCGVDQEEEGVITSISDNGSIVFVRYGSGVGSKGTYVGDLHYLI